MIEKFNVTVDEPFLGINLKLPWYRIKAKKTGPVVVIDAAQHGRELNGIEVIRRLLPFLEKNLQFGTCRLLPCVNPLGVYSQQQDFPFEYNRYIRSAPNFNMNRTWPGLADNTLASATTAAIWNGLIMDADINIDLHGWSGQSCSLVWGYDADLVRVFGLTTHMVCNEQEAKNPTRQLEKACHQAGIRHLTAELVPQHKLSEESIALGYRGVCNVLKHLGMLPGKPELPERQFEFTNSDKEHVVKAATAGMLVCRKNIGDAVTEGDLLAEIINPFDVRQTTPVHSPADGFIFNLGAERWGEHTPESSIVYPSTMVAIVKEIGTVIENDVNLK